MSDAVDRIAVALRRERARLRLSLAEVARRAGVSKSTLSQLEAGSGNPSVETLWALSVALDVPFGRLVEGPRTTVRVVRSGEGPALHSQESPYMATLLSSCPPGVRRDAYLISAEPGPARTSEAHNPGTVEHVVLATGTALVGPADDPVELQPGDYIMYPGDEPHVFESRAPGTTAVLFSDLS